MAVLKLNVETEVHGASKLRNLAGDVAKIGVGAVAGLTAVGAFTANFASDLNESLSKVGVVFGDNADDIRNWAKSSAKSMGISQQAALESAGTFGNLFTAMEIGQKPAAEMSTELVELASDLASFNNIDPAEALEKLRAGIVGEAEPLRTLGVNISAAATEQKALELGIWDGVGALTAAQKAQANYALIMEQTSTAQGDFARTSDGMANQQRTLAATFQDTMAMLGQAFVPIIEAILPQLTAGLQAFGGWVSSNGPAIGNVLSGIATAIGQGFTFVVEVVIPALVTAFQFVAKNILPGLVAAFQAVASWVQANWPRISSVIGQVMGAIISAVRFAWPILERIATVLFPAIGAAATVLFNTIDAAFKLIGGVFRVAATVFEAVGNVIFKPFSDGFEAVIGFIRGLWNSFASWWNSIQISVPSIEIPFVGTVGGWTVGLPDLPMLAQGGIVTRPTLAIIGEQGPEAVVPLRGRGMPGATNTFNFYSPLPIEDDRDVVERIERAQRLQALGTF